MISERQYRNVVPLIKVVKAAIVDVHGDIGVLQQQYSHWAARGLEKLQRESLKHGKRKVLLPISMNTLTAPIPIDCGGFIFVGFIDEDGFKNPITYNGNIVSADDVEVAEEKKCSKCNQPLSICNDIQLSEETNLIVINGNTYEESVTRKLYPNGDVYMESSTPTLNVETGIVEYETSKKFIANLDLDDCGCPVNSEENIEVVKKYLPDVYACHYSQCCSNSSSPNYGSVRINFETGFISVSPDFPFKYLYVEYYAFMPKMNGQYVVPRVAFETLVNFTKFKEVENKRSVPLVERNWYLQQYIRERTNMEKVMGKVTLSKLVQLFGITPRFGVNDPTVRQVVNRTCTSTSSSQTSSQQVVQTVVEVRETVSDIAYGKIIFEIGNPDTNPPMNAGDTVLTINDTGVLENSVNVIVDSIPVTEGATDEVSCTVTYGLNGFTLTFTEPAYNTQKYKITYIKKVTS
jgi:hypothetical protein